MDQNIKNQVFKSVKNIIHNEHNITKEDITKMIDIAIAKETKKYIENNQSKLDYYCREYIKSLVESTIGKNTFMGYQQGIKNELMKQIGELILSFEISVKQK